VRSSSLKVLIVEDDAATARCLEQILTRNGHVVRIVSDGDSALEEAAREAPDVAFLDISLRGRLDGYAVARSLQEPRDGKRPLLVVLTGFLAEEYRQRSCEEGIDLHLTKPVEPEAIRNLLERFAEVLSPPEQSRTDSGPQWN
jgi:CheY-like chemotaxis protein